MKEKSSNHRVVISSQPEISIDDVKEAAVAVFESNYLILSQKAAKIASERAKELVEKFLVELEKRNPESLQNMENPAEQAALFTAQKEYAKSGDKDLAEVLVDILVDRISISERTLKQIVLDESLNVISKLTNDQLDTLTIVFMLKYSFSEVILDLETLEEYLEKYLRPFIDSLSTEDSLYQHLEYCGCSNHQDKTTRIETIFDTNYGGLFSEGFALEDFDMHVTSEPKYKEYLKKCLHNNNRWQLDFINVAKIEKQLQLEKTPYPIMYKMTSYFHATKMSALNISNYLINKGEYMRRLFEIWNNSNMESLALTSVGIALAQANFRRKTGVTIELERWIK